ncbi:MAG TPA: wax ester/triacylglycerol synthase domain-containing protein [Acidimicrobiales bacterium]|nr:wax ester/triacylglycerol synthase domain-containing protein [Acidimicrobiales bacterium]
MDTMNASDAVLWAIERDPKLRTTVTAVALLDRPPNVNRLRHRVEAAVGAFPRLREHVVDGPLGMGHPHWAPYLDFELDRHLREVDGGGGGIRDLLDTASSLAEAGFDRSGPLWEILIVRDLDSGRSALIEKFHHSLTDGMGGIELLLSLLDWSRRPRKELDLRNAPTAEPSDGDGYLGEMAHRLQDVARTVSGLPPTLWRSATHPVDTLADGLRTTRSIARLITPSTRPLSPLFAGRSTSWRFDMHEESMDALHAAAAAASGTVNDVFLAAIAGALYRYHARFGHRIHALRVNLPVSFRHPGDPFGGNRWTPVRFVVPVDEPDPARRIRQVGELCRAWRKEPALPLTDNIADVLSRLPDPATTAVLGSLMYGVDFVATNVPGVARRCYIAGAEVTRQFAFAPLGGSAANFALVSHAGTACIGVNTDRTAVTDPSFLMTCLAEGFSEVTALAR